MKGRSIHRRSAETGLPMTPMIDIVFLLLVFFILTYQLLPPEAHLDALTAGGKAGDKVYLELTVNADSYCVNGLPFTLSEVGRVLSSLRALQADTGVVIRAARDARTARLIALLDLCGHLGLRRISVALLSPSA